MGRLGCRKCRNPGARGGRRRLRSFHRPHSQRVPASSSSSSSPDNTMAGHLCRGPDKAFYSSWPQPFVISLQSPTAVPCAEQCVFKLALSRRPWSSWIKETIHQEERKRCRTLTFLCVSPVGVASTLSPVPPTLPHLGSAEWCEFILSRRKERSGSLRSMCLWVCR